MDTLLVFTVLVVGLVVLDVLAVRFGVDSRRTVGHERTERPSVWW